MNKKGHEQTKLAGVIGWPVSHSLSPALHGYWLSQHQIDGAYVPLAVAPENLETAIRGLPALGFKGCNVTVPHKERVLPLLDELSATAEKIGAVNTIICQPDGTMFGDNTDAFGFRENLSEGVPDLLWDGGRALIVGAGGAARAIVYACLDMGFDEVVICNRTHERAEELASHFGRAAQAVDWNKMPASLANTTLLINTTTLGMAGHDPLDIDLSALPPAAAVTDIVYTPLLTPLLADAKNHGLKTVDGLGMLLHQARPGFAAWFGQATEVDDGLRQHLLSILAAR